MKTQARLKYHLKVRALRNLIQQVKWQGTGFTQEDLGGIDLHLETTDQDEYLEQIALINAKLEDLRDFLNDRRFENRAETKGEPNENLFSLDYYHQD